MIMSSKDDVYLRNSVGELDVSWFPAMSESDDELTSLLFESLADLAGIFTKIDVFEFVFVFRNHPSIEIRPCHTQKSNFEVVSGNDVVIEPISKVLTSLSLLYISKQPGKGAILDKFVKLLSAKVKLMVAIACNVDL